mgnify:CR=1 FL=1
MSQALIGIDPTDFRATVAAGGGPAFKLGTYGGWDDPLEGLKVYIYGQATAAITQFFCCVEGIANANFSMITTANTAPGQLGGHGARVGVAQATLATGQFGWFQIAGRGTVNTLASAALGTRLNTTATAGSVDDDGTAGARVINGMVLKAATGGAQANNSSAVLQYPTVGLTI